MKICNIYENQRLWKSIQPLWIWTYQAIFFPFLNTSLKDDLHCKNLKHLNQSLSNSEIPFSDYKTKNTEKQKKKKKHLRKKTW